VIRRGGFEARANKNSEAISRQADIKRVFDQEQA
jgi:hypothetical protein